MSQILEDNFNSFIGATYGCEPIELPGEQLRGLRFAFFGGAMIVNSCIVEKQRESDVELFNLQTEFNDALEEFKKELEVYIDADVANSENLNIKAHISPEIKLEKAISLLMQTTEFEVSDKFRNKVNELKF